MHGFARFGFWLIMLGLLALVGNWIAGNLMGAARRG
jgi:hypothetical protein